MYDPSINHITIQDLRKAKDVTGLLAALEDSRVLAEDRSYLRW
jgi:hypothetical protein